MPIERRPANPLPKNYVPSGGLPYRVKTNDDWYSVARDHGIGAHDLIQFNFATTEPSEVNWYLRNNVGCVKHTHDNLNWMFSSEAMPGIIYIPPRAGWHRPSFPPGTAPPGPGPGAKPERSGIWFGLGLQGGGHLAVAGKDTVEGWIYSLESFHDRFWMNIDGYRVGPGLGGSVGVVFVMVTGARTPGAIQGLKVSGWDFQANLGGRWGDLAKGLKGMKAVSRVATAGKIIDRSISVAEWEKLRDAVWNGIKALQIDTKSAKPEVNVIALPGAGTGVELSGFYGWGTVFVHDVTLQ